MAFDWYQYPVSSLLFDQTCTALAANSNITSPTSGTKTVGTSTIGATQYSISSSSVPPSEYWDLTDIIIDPPVDAGGTTPDVYLTWTVDNKDLSTYQVMDASADGNFFPDPNNTVALRAIRLGLPLYDVLWDAAHGKPMANIPLYTTGFKAKNSITVTVYTTAGWGQNGTVVSPLRIRGYGRRLTAAQLDDLTLTWNQYSRVSKLIAPGQGIELSNLMAGDVLSKAWQTLPGGGLQQQVKINRRFTFASNNATITTSNSFAFTQDNALQGTDANVIDPKHDLGDNFSSNSNVFLYNEFGVKLAQGVEGYVAYAINNNLVPQDTQQGTPISYSKNPFAYGSVQPQRTDSNLYYPLPSARRLVQLMVAGQGVVPVFKAAGSNIDAGGVTIAKGGVLIEQ